MMVDAGESVRPFFGSWYDIKDYKQTGYNLGHEMVKSLTAGESLPEIALAEDSDWLFKPLLEDWCLSPR
jgi:hypothetical protein